MRSSDGDVTLACEFSCLLETGVFRVGSVTVAGGVALGGGGCGEFLAEVVKVLVSRAGDIAGGVGVTGGDVEGVRSVEFVDGLGSVAALCGVDAHGSRDDASGVVAAKGRTAGCGVAGRDSGVVGGAVDAAGADGSVAGEQAQEIGGDQCRILGDGAGIAGSGVGATCVRPEGAGRHWERNREWRLKKSEKKRKRRGVSSGVVDANAPVVDADVPEWRKGARPVMLVDEELRGSLQEKWKAENRLAKLKAERQFELLQAQNIDDVKKMQRAQVLRTTETCKVQVERAFKSLKKNGNVPADGSGSAETVVSEGDAPGLSRSDGSGISPDSSVSQQEIRQMQKDLLDAAEREKKTEEALGFLKYAAPELYKQAMVRANCKKAYTLDSQGQPEIDTVGSIRDGKFYPDFLHEHYAPNPLHRNARNEVPFPGEEDLW